MTYGELDFYAGPSSPFSMAGNLLRPILILQAWLTTTVIAYIMALYLDFHPPTYSAEATQYREIVAAVTSGFTLGNAVQKLGFLSANIIGGFGVALMALRARIGIAFFLFSPVVLCVADRLGASEAAYPGIENKNVTLLWCICGALWGASCMFAWLQRMQLFPSRNTQMLSSASLGE